MFGLLDAWSKYIAEPHHGGAVEEWSVVHAGVCCAGPWLPDASAVVPADCRGRLLARSNAEGVCFTGSTKGSGGALALCSPLRQRQS